MLCNLCEKEIKNYVPKFNHLIIDDDHSIDICRDCVDKFTMWQGEIIADLFPSKIMKKRYDKKK
jgi:hypothetical protein